MESRSILCAGRSGPITRRIPQVALLMGLAAVSGNVPVLAQEAGLGPPLSLDQFGVLESSSSNNFNTGATNGFFANLGTNGRTCGSCHVEADAWTFTPLHAQLLAHDDPLFAPVDGSDCPPVSANQEPNRENSSMVLKYGVIRIQLAIPTTAGFTLASTTNPKGCAIPPGSPAISGDLFLFRRPLPSTNLLLLSAVMWDGRETLQKITTLAGEESTAPLLFDLADQANSATTTHAQGAPIAGTQAQQDIVNFEMGLSTAQVILVPDFSIALLDVGADGGANYLQNTVAPTFFIGVNNPLSAPFTNTVFTLYSAWEPSSPEYRHLNPVQQAIGRGEAIFNTTTFVIHDVPGLNSVSTDPLYNPADPLAGQDVVAGCGLCHNNPNVGNHSTALAINIGVTMARPTNNDGSVDARAIITDLDEDLIGSALCLDPKSPGRRLSGGGAVLLTLQAMIDRVAHDMEHGLKQHFDDRLVGFRFVSLDEDPYRFAESRGHLPNDAGETLQDRAQWPYPHSNYGSLQITDEALESALAIFQNVRERRVTSLSELDGMPEGIVDNRELASQTHQPIDLFRIDSEGALRDLRWLDEIGRHRQARDGFLAQ
jgi:cytochrome c peroxidase